MADPTPQAPHRTTRPPIAPLIDLDTMTESLSLVTINGTKYPIRPKDLLSLREQKLCIRLGNRFDELFERQAPLTDEEEAEMVGALDQLTRMVLTAPDEIHRALNDFQRRVIVETFTQLPIQSLRMWGALIAEARQHPLLNDVPLIGPSSSSGASGSTGSAPGGRGTRRRRSGGSTRRSR